jgi:UDP-N-acetylglucosamine--N-acetylmuramyl-(pentapeptide) pyrophosphoryl-undecaprenol N-acetylglucosamine transferase
VAYIGTDGMEKRLIEPWHLPYFTISCPKLVRGGGFPAFKRNLKIPSAFFKAVKQAKQALKSYQPNAVFSKGGYVSLPVVIAAWQLKIPCFAHESDFSLGLANRLSMPFCKQVFTSFPETAKRLKKGVYSGAPIRSIIFSSTRAEARRQLGIPFCATVLLIFGGGSGSEPINQAVFKQLSHLTQVYYILHVVGKGNAVQTDVKNYQQFEFVADMGRLYAAADLIISRAGAGTVFEILARKKPALFIPLEGQTRGDQVQNAEYFQKRGLCRVLRQNKLDLLSQEIEKTLLDKQLVGALEQANYPSGNQTIVSALLSVKRNETATPENERTEGNTK